MVCKITGFGLWGVDAFLVTVEVDILTGLPHIEIVGLPDTSVREARDRMNSALSNSGFDFPMKNMVINLAPASRKKSGALYDLPILIGVLRCTEQIPSVSGYGFVGEVTLDGSLRPVTGALSMALCAQEQGLKGLFLPVDNAAEAAAVEGVPIYPCRNLKEVVAHFVGTNPITPAKPSTPTRANLQGLPDFADVKGQSVARKGMEIAAAGGHSVLLIGSPGSGKSMLAKCLPSILPPMNRQELLETTRIHSVAGILDANTPLVLERPFRSPHHTISTASLAGGGSSLLQPGEISLAHNGVLFLDELPEFSRPAMEVLRQPMEDGIVSISRVAGRLVYPCAITLVAAMNPCPCGYWGHPTKKCTCPGTKAQKYLGRISGPLLDRLDLRIQVMPVDFSTLLSEERSESSADIAVRVAAARRIQQERYKGEISCNAQLTPSLLVQHCALSAEDNAFLVSALENLSLSPRGATRLLKIARTIADLEAVPNITRAHLSSALFFRKLTSTYWTP